MDTRNGTLHEHDEDKLRELMEERPMDLETFGYGEVVQIKGGFFEVAKIDTRRQRIVLKPIPRPEPAK